MDSLVCRGKEARHRRRAREQRVALRAREPVVALPHEHVDEAGEIGLRWGVVRMIAEALTSRTRLHSGRPVQGGQAKLFS